MRADFAGLNAESVGWQLSVSRSSHPPGAYAVHGCDGDRDGDEHSSSMANLKTYLAERWGGGRGGEADCRYMSGPKADAILAHAGEKKKKRKRAKNEDYVGGTASVGGGGGLVLQDDDDWRARRRKAELEGEDAPGGCFGASC